METAANNLTCLLIQRIVVPLVLLLCALFRPVGISYVYLLMFFISPFVPISTPNNFRRSISAYFIIFISLSVILVLCHMSLQFMIITEGYSSIIGQTCSFIELLLRHIGFISFVKLGILDIIIWVAPEVVALIASILTFVFIKKKTLKPKEEDGNDHNSHISHNRNVPSPQVLKQRNYNLVYKIGPAVSLASLFVTATLRPSIPGLIYFLVFLASGTYWATYRRFNRRFATTLQLSLVVLVCHIILIVAYQTPWPQEYIKHEDLIARLFALEPLIKSDCTNDIRVIEYNSYFNVDSFFVPIVILISYHILALTAKNMNNSEPISQTSRGPTFETDIQLEILNRDTFENYSKISVVGQIYYGLKSVAGFIHENSYILTNVLMMIWSIVFHSWLSFIFLLWANVLWMIPNQRKAMMRSSPLIVFYAELLLIIDYVYAIYIIDAESSKGTTLNIHQIGFHKPSRIPITNFLVKTIFTVMFWITLRQTCRESDGRKKHSVLLDYVTKVTSLKARRSTRAARQTFIFKKSGEIFKSLLVRLWIWILLIIIFMCAITGTVMNAFRICYMALFLFFLLAFQTSSKVWIKLMYGFWIFLIFYAMTILILTYTYQFDNFNEYWTEFLNMSEGLQDDVGLEKYKTKDLFIHLLSPTAIVILTVIQVHYFHKRLVDSLKGESINVNASSSAELNPENSESSEEQVIITRFSKQWLLLKIKELHLSLKGLKELIWLFLELHLMKIIYLTAFLSSVTEFCVLHIFIAIFSVIGVVSPRTIQIIISRIISFIVSLIILTKMIYQVTYIDHSSYNVVCKNKYSTNTTQNTAVWFGFEKTNVDQTLIHILKKYIIYMLLVTIHAVVLLRQNQKRKLVGNTSENSPRVLFPKITRKDAEKNLKGLVKYLFNYGFYKFGLEITLIGLVVLISYREDVITIPYAIWLCILIFLERSDCAKLWFIFKWFTATLIILQYIFFVQLPPTLCIEYPWEDSPYDEGLQLWGLLPGKNNYRHTDKLIFDFILLMFITRQKIVFQKEKEIFTNLTEYPGGSNRSVLLDIENVEFTSLENPTSDFITNVRNWLDVYRNAVLCGLYWITLALLFMAGTYGSDIFSLGYLAGSCIFLWQGTDFYLRPISQILKWWKLLIFYNVTLIIAHELLQIARYLFLDTLKENSCWIVHLFALTYPEVLKSIEDNPICPAIEYDPLTHWNVICFTFLIFQLRIFKSHYFCHIINDTKADLILASRGAELIEDLRRKQFDHNKKHEQEVLLKIKKKMEKIRSNQQKLKMAEPNTHFEVEEDTESSNEISNISSCHSTGYHTPNIEGQLNDYNGLFSSDIENFKAPSSSSVAMTISMDGYEEPKRLSLESNLELLKEKTQIDSTMLLSPASALKLNISSNGNNNDDKQHRRQSSGITVSWNEPIEKLEKSMDSINVSLDENDDNSNILPHSSLYKRRNNISNSFHIYDDQLNKVCCRRRFSNISYLRDDKLSKRPSYKRPYSWGPISHICYLEPFISTIPKPTTHHQSISAGDYYMFQDLDEQFKLDVIESDKGDFLEQEEKKKEETLTKDKRDSEVSSHIPDEPVPDIAPIPKEPKTQGPLIKDYECIKRIKTFFRRGLSFATHKINGLSRNYRYVMRVLNFEKKVLKESNSYERSVRTGVSKIWTPFVYLKNHLLNKEVEPEAPYVPAITTSEGIITYGFHDKFTSRKHSKIIELLISIWYAIISNTDILCYLAIFLNQVVNASVMSLPLPLMVFLWGTLSLPRPTKTFWVTLIAYTQAIVFIKALFQFKSIWSNYANLPSQQSNATLVGVELDKLYAVYDLLLLLFLFSHRVVLKSQGLWKSEAREELYEEQNLVTEDDTVSVDNTVAATSNQMDNASFTSLDEKSVIQATKLNTDVASESAIEVSETSGQKEPTLNIPGFTKFACIKYFSSIRNFFYDLIKKPRLPADVYSLMFLCDFINFFVLLFGFAAFGPQNSEATTEGVHKYLSENNVPIPFLIMLLIQFLLIIIDRALYLRKALVNKIVFHFFSVIGIHIWMFFVLPALTEIKFHHLIPPVIFYLIKCIYFLLSSYQIKRGYPKRLLGNFLTRGFALWNMVAFKSYMIMPFLYELRTILDWVCTETTMSLGDWLKMEDIFTNIYFIKCSRQFEIDFPAPRGSTKPILVKSLVGGILLLVLIFLIWGPLSIFAIGNAVGQSNIPYQVSASFQIGFYDPIYQTVRDRIFPFDRNMKTVLEGAYISDKRVQGFLTEYDPDDIAAVTFPLNSPSLWNISPPDKQNLLNDLINKETLICRFKYTIFRLSSTGKTKNEISSEVLFVINDTFVGRDTMINMLQGNPTTEPVVIPGIFPKFVKVINSGSMHAVSLLMLNEPAYRSLILKIFQENGQIWWQIKEDCSDNFYKNTLAHLPYTNCDSELVMYTFNDKKFSSVLSFFTFGYGILGLYASFVFVASKVLKTVMTGQHRSIMFVDLPYADRVLQLCLDVYLVREALEFTLEEDLFAKLIFLYRSPTTMIKWTQHVWGQNSEEQRREIRKRPSERSRTITID